MHLCCLMPPFVGSVVSAQLALFLITVKARYFNHSYCKQRANFNHPFGPVKMQPGCLGPSEADNVTIELFSLLPQEPYENEFCW